MINRILSVSMVIFLSLVLTGCSNSREQQPKKENLQTKNKILVVFSGVDYVSLKNGKKHATGFFLSELATPLQGLLASGFEVVFANPTGKEPAMDKVSNNATWFKSIEEYERAKTTLQSIVGLKTPRTLASISEAELEGFAGIFLPGGHAPMEDLYKDKELGRILKHFHEKGKPTGLICHAPVALLSAKNGNDWIYKGYKITLFSNAEEKQEEDAGHLDGFLNFYVADVLSEAGAIVSQAQPWTGNVVRDRELITGQNPMSDTIFRDLFIEALFEQRSKELTTIKWSIDDETLLTDILYDASIKLTDWESGFVTLYVGKKKPELKSGEFLTRLNTHIILARSELGKLGLNGYIFFVSNNTEVAYQSWTTKEAADLAFASVQGANISSDANSFMEFVLFKEVNVKPVWLGKRN